MLVETLKSIDHGGLRRKHEQFIVSDVVGKELIRRGLAIDASDITPAPIEESPDPPIEKKTKRGRPKK